MMPEDWPSAAPDGERTPPARAAGRSRLSTVRADFFLDPADRLSEQERALMTAMLHSLVGDIAAELRVQLPPGWAGANDEDSAIVERMASAGLLDIGVLVAILLRSADEERIAGAAAARGGGSEGRVLQSLVSSSDAEVASSAMALILARGRRRDRFGQMMVDFDDLPAAIAEPLVQRVAAAVRGEIAAREGKAAVDRALGDASAAFLARHDPGRSLAALTARLVEALDASGGLDEDWLLACARDGEIGLVAAAVARRAGVSADVAFDQLLSGDPKPAMALLRAGGLSRGLAAGLLAGLGDLIGISDPAAAIGEYDRIDEAEAAAIAAALAAPVEYRAALEELDRNG